jgi:serine O-acetyltransferase
MFQVADFSREFGKIHMEKNFAEELLKIRQSNTTVFPSTQNVQNFANDLIELLFPHYSGEYEYFAASEIQGKFDLLQRDLRKILILQQPSQSKKMAEVTKKFFDQIPGIYRNLSRDALAIHEGDPASESVDEVISAYPGFFAIYTYRIAHELYMMEIPVFPRMLTEYAHHRTGVDIHPGATIGNSFFIDHGTGIVVGETTIIGDNVKIYQGVTLGALSVKKSDKIKKRHPTIEDNVIIYSNATILGGETVIGHDSIIGGNVWLTKSVQSYSIVYQKSEIDVRTKNNGSGAINFSI